MANNDAPFGLRPSRKVGGAYFTGGESRFRVTTSGSTNTTNIYQGDVVTQDTGGIVTRIARADGGSATSAIIVGVFWGCFYTDPTTSKPTWSNYWPGNAATDAIGFIIDDPLVVFEVQICLVTLISLITVELAAQTAAGPTWNSMCQQEPPRPHCP